MSLNESIVEEAALDWLQSLGYETAFGPEIAPDGARPERGGYQVPLLLGRLQAAIGSIQATLLASDPEEPGRASMTALSARLAAGYNHRQQQHTQITLHQVEAARRV